MPRGPVILSAAKDLGWPQRDSSLRCAPFRMTSWQFLGAGAGPERREGPAKAKHLLLTKVKCFTPLRSVQHDVCPVSWYPGIWDAPRVGWGAIIPELKADCMPCPDRRTVVRRERFWGREQFLGRSDFGAGTAFWIC